MVGLFPRLRMGIDGEGVTKTGTYVSFECILKIVDRSCLSELRNMFAKTLGEGKRTIHELGNLSCSPPGKKPAVTGKQELMHTAERAANGFPTQEPSRNPAGMVFNLLPTVIYISKPVSSTLELVRVSWSICC